MSNSSVLFALEEEFYPINDKYFFAAVQKEILMSIVLIPNLYFLYAILTSAVFKKRQTLKRTVFLFNILNILFIANNLLISSYYLYLYHHGGVIRVKICSYMRKIQMILISFLVTTPLVITVHRYFTIFSRRNLQIYIAFAVFILSNFPSFTLFATMFFQSGTKWVPDEICTLIKGSTLPIVDKISDLLYYFAATVPLIVGFINFYMIKCLNLHASKFSSSKSKQNDNKTIFINLIIQTFQPLIGQGPLI
uniref:G_PROTEIN_RECEP_F1_2 domain-containing protein n=1 Tax=Strongyloides venezuelensis TaxID=75913 RepID=A0A0K0G620_STRVS